MALKVLIIIALLALSLTEARDLIETSNEADQKEDKGYRAKNNVQAIGGYPGGYYPGYGGYFPLGGYGGYPGGGFGGFPGGFGFGPFAGFPIGGFGGFPFGGLGGYLGGGLTGSGTGRRN